jgi:hypothetical protein
MFPLGLSFRSVRPDGRLVGGCGAHTRSSCFWSVYVSMGINPYNTGIGIHSVNTHLGRELVEAVQGLRSLKGPSDRTHCLGRYEKLYGCMRVNAYQRVVTAENDGNLPPFGVARHDIGYTFADPGHKSRVLHLADWWVVFLSDLFELVVAVKLNLPPQVLELLFEAGFN